MNHFDEKGNAIMVDVSEKNSSVRIAIATGKIFVGPQVMKAVKEHTTSKGDVLGVARMAGIMAVKKTSDMIPLCHPLGISKCSIDFELLEEFSIRAECMVKVEGKTGVEMEALHGVSVTLLTIYDMCKAIDKSMHIEEIHLISKEGGKSGAFYFEKKSDETADEVVNE